MATQHSQPSATSSGKTSSVDVEEPDLIASVPSTLKKSVGETHELVAVKDSSKTSHVGVAMIVPVGEDGNDIFISEPQHLMKKELSLWSLIGFGMEVMNGWVASPSSSRLLLQEKPQLNPPSSPSLSRLDACHRTLTRGHCRHLVWFDLPALLQRHSRVLSRRDGVRHALCGRPSPSFFAW